MTKRKAPEDRKPLGRPPGTDGYTLEIDAEICSRISKGEPLTKMCREDEWLPSRETVYAWQDKYPEFAERFAQARVRGFDAIADDCVDIADNPIPTADTQRDKLRVETRLKLLAKWDPRRYGDKLQTEHSVSESLADLITESFKKD